MAVREPAVDAFRVVPKSRRGRCRGERGEVTATVLMVPLVLLAMMLVVQFGLAYHARQVVAGAAQDGAASAARLDSTPGVGAALTDSLIDQGAGSLVTSHSASGSSDGEVVTVRAQATVVRVLPLFPAITVRARSSAALEQFDPQAGP